ncbi:MAG: 3-dehydroquinate synthase [Clostridia bacterium]|nr:3-dehydroquinate synthase [Clostridia bacterium]
MQTIQVSGSHYRYEISINEGLIDDLAREILCHISLKRALVVSDERVWSLYGPAITRSFAAAQLESSALILKTGGYAATLDALKEISAAMEGLTLGPEDGLVVIGGGTLCDTGGFAAWHHKDVVRLIQVPTTMIGMTDWAVEGKSALEYRPGSKMIGSFFPPSLVLIDPRCALSLNERVFDAGMGEVIKCACAADAPLFRLLESLDGRTALQQRLEEITWRCLYVKRALIQKDARLTMLGHGIAHAVEATQRYRILLHGEAVAVGMYCVTRRGEALGYTQKGTAERLEACLNRYHLPTSTLVDSESMLRAIQALGECVTPVPQRIGFCEALTVSNAFLVNAWFGGIAY